MYNTGKMCTQISLSHDVYLRISLYVSGFILIQLSDFGLAVAGGIRSTYNVKLSGTLGYLAPEYLLDGMQKFHKGFKP